MKCWHICDLQFVQSIVQSIVQSMFPWFIVSFTWLTWSIFTSGWGGWTFSLLTATGTAGFLGSMPRCTSVNWPWPKNFRQEFCIRFKWQIFCYTNGDLTWHTSSVVWIPQYVTVHMHYYRINWCFWGLITGIWYNAYSACSVLAHLNSMVTWLFTQVNLYSWLTIQICTPMTWNCLVFSCLISPFTYLCATFKLHLTYCSKLDVYIKY